MKSKLQDLATDEEGRQIRQQSCLALEEMTNKYD